MATQPRHFLTSDEYLDLERPAEFRSEYVDGEMFAMAGASPIHDAIVKNVSDFFTNRKLRSCSCLAFTSNMKVYLRDDCVFCYPDLTICCGEPAFHDGNQDVLLNPTAVFEVLSPSTKSYDLGDKSFYYRRNPSLRHLILIWSDRLRIGHWTRQEDKPWTYTEYESAADTIRFPEMNLDLSTGDVYEGIPPENL